MPHNSGLILCVSESCIFSVHVRWVSRHHSMACPQVADGGDSLQIWKAAVNILNKQSRRANKGWYCSLGARHGANNSSPEKNKLVMKCHKGSQT
jgi:hypothetical protein